MFYFDIWYLYLILPAALLAMYAQVKINSTYSKFSKVASRRGITGAEVARRILDQNGLQSVQIGHVAGNLTDHYDPRTQVVNLSDSVYNSTSVAAIGVAAHETGHAVQHAVGYAPIKIRNAIVPVVNIGSTLSIPLFLLGFLFSIGILADIGIILFSFAVLFQLVTLPVEFNASRRAIATLESGYILDDEELGGAKKVLGAAAMTYVASAAMALAQLLRLILIRGNRD